MKKLTYFVIFLMLAALLLAATFGVPMAINFQNGQSLDFGTLPASISTPTARTWAAWVNFTAAQTTGFTHVVFWAQDPVLLTAAWSVEYFSDAPGTYLWFTQYWSGATAIWQSSSNLGTNAWHHIAITFDEGNAANNPIFYVDGTAVSITEIGTPSGTPENDADAVLYLGGVGTATPYSKIIISDARIYNRILTASEIADIYAARTYGDNINGLVFNPILYGSAVTAFDGATLSTSNKIIDPYTLAQGTPQGSPVGVGETYLRLR